MGISLYTDPRTAGWGLLTGATLPDEARDALEALRKHRSGRTMEVFPGESPEGFLARNRLGSGEHCADNPYFLLIAASPDEISFEFQAELGRDFAVGRLWFDEPGATQAYVDNLLGVEQHPGARRRSYVVLGPANPDDAVSQQSSAALAAPLADSLAASLQRLRQEDEAIIRLLGEQATKNNLLGRLLGEAPPNLLIAAGHSLGFPDIDDADAPAAHLLQGGLVCQDWPGPLAWQKEIPEAFYLSANDLPPFGLQGMAAILLASYSLGTPRNPPEGGREQPGTRSRRAFVSALAQRMLQAGAQAVIGLPQRAWSFPFMQSGQVILNHLARLVDATSVYENYGAALQHLRQSALDLDEAVNRELQEYTVRKDYSVERLAGMWAARSDLRNLALLGDPAACLPAVAREEAAVEQVARQVARHVARTAAAPGGVRREAADLFIRLARLEGAQYIVELRLELEGSDTELAPRTGRASFAFDRLASLANDAGQYGRLLGDGVFADSALVDYYHQALQVTRSSGIELRLHVETDPRAPELNELAWEALRVPGTESAVGLESGASFSRYLPSTVWQRQELRPLTSLCSLAVVPYPLKAEASKAIIDPAGMVAALQQGLQGIDLRLLGAEPDRPGEVRWSEFQAALREGADILYTGSPYMFDRAGRLVYYFIDDGGKQLLVEPARVCELIASLPLEKRPRLVGVWSSVANVKQRQAMVEFAGGLLQAGVGACLYVQHAFYTRSAEVFLPVFMAELLSTGRIDLATATARQKIAGMPDWWAPVLVSRTKDSRAWLAESAETGLSDLPEPQVLPEAGELPAGSYLPRQRSTFFTGRQELLLQLARELFYRPERQRKPVALSGGPGSGKSALAVELCYRYGRYLQGVHWLRANEIEADLAACGQAMGLPDWPADQAGQVQATLQAWQASAGAGRPRLVVLDDASHSATLKQWLPRLKGLAVLVTSRLSRWPKSTPVKMIKIEAFTRPESRALLRSLAPTLAGQPDELVDELAALMGDLPFALHMAATEISAAEISAAEAAGKAPGMQNPTFEFIQRLKSTVASGKAPTGLDALLEASWKRLDDEGEVGDLAQHIQLALSYCEPNLPIPLLVVEALGHNWLTGGAELPETGAPEAGATEDGVPEAGVPEAGAPIEAAVRRLAELHFLAINPESVQIHPLVAGYGATKDLAEQGAGLQAIADALATASEQALLPNMRQHLETAVEAAIYAEQYAGLHLLVALGREHERAGQFSETARAYLRTLQYGEKFGLSESEQGVLLDGAGRAYMAAGELDMAGKYLLQGLHLRQRALGERHPDTAQSLNNMGFYLQARGQLEQALAYYQQSLAINREVLGEQHQETVTNINNIALVLQAKGDLHGARAHFEQALSILMSTVGERHLQTILLMSNLGFTLYDMGDFQAARPMMEQAYALRQELLGDHPDTAGSLNNLAMLNQALGDLPQAQQQYLQALSMVERAYGPQHPDVANILINVGQALEQTGDLNGAVQAAQRSLEIYRRTLGEAHPQTATAMVSLAQPLRSLGRLEEALSLIQRALAIVRERLGGDSPSVARILQPLALVMADMGQLQEAKAMLYSALEIAQGLYGEQHMLTASLVYDLGNLARRTNELLRAGEYYERALAIYQAILPPDHPTLRSLQERITELKRAIERLNDQRKSTR